MTDASLEVEESSLAAIEDMEQQLIQHLRTSGLRKPRETSLIEEIMVIRRERRKLFASIQEKIATLQTAVADTTKKSDSISLTRIHELEIQLATNQRQVDDLKRKHAMDMRELRDRNSARLHSDVEELSRKYEYQLRTLEAKIDELSSAKASKERADAEARAAGVLEEHLSKLEKHYSLKLQKYKDTIGSLVEKEKELIENAKRKAFQLQKAKELIERAEGQVASAESLAHAEKIKASDYQAKLQTTTNALTATEEEMRRLRIRLAGLEEQASANTRRLQQEHQEQLDRVDRKIRLVLAEKDDTISRLTHQINDLTAAGTATENMLRELNAKL